MTMTTTLQRTLLGQGVTSVAEALGAGHAAFGDTDPGPIRILRLSAEVASSCATELQLLGEDLTCSGMSAAERARLGRVDGNAELSRLRGNEQSLGEAPVVEGTAKVRAAELRELGDGYEAVELIGVGARQLRRAAGGGMLCLTGLVSYIDRLTRSAVAEVLADDSVAKEERTALAAEFSPRLSMLQSEQDARDERVAKNERVLGPLRRAAEDAEEEEEARAILAAAESGAALSPEQALRALDWRRRCDERDDALADGLLLQAEEPAVPARRRTSAGRTAKGRGSQSSR